MSIDNEGSSFRANEKGPRQNLNTKLLAALALAHFSGPSTEQNEGLGSYFSIPVRELIYQSIDPRSYYTFPMTADEVVAAVTRSLSSGPHRSLERAGVSTKELRMMSNRLDAWRLYLQLPQLYGSFFESRFRPSLGKIDQNGPVYKYYRIPDWLDNLVGSTISDITDVKPEDPTSVAEVSPLLHTKKAVLKYLVERLREREGNRMLSVDEQSGVMGGYTLSLGRDERGEYISYYDRWDLKGSPEGKSGIIGIPFNIYDRIYFDSKTFEPK